MSADFSCDLSAPASPLPHVWEHTVGSGHAALALRADWQGQMARSHAELGFRHVRFHGVLDDEMDTLVRAGDRRVHSFFNSDQIFDFLTGIGMRPFVELSFMPTALASGSTTVFRYRANVTPPKDFAQWADLIGALVGHWVERYGAGEVRRWFFEVWNEPNLKEFWTGDQAGYFELYRRTVGAIKAVDRELKVGGPATAMNAWIDDFLAFCAAERVPADFVSTHHYPGDAFGRPGDDSEAQLARSRRGALREEARATKQESQGKPVYYTEWCTSSNPFDPLHDEPYAAAQAVKTNLEAVGLVDGCSWWTFSDLFAENYLSSVPFHGGFGLLTIHGVAKPAYRAYQLLHGLGVEQLPTVGSHATVDVWVVRCGPDRVTAIATNTALPRHEIASEHVRIAIGPATRPSRATIARIDADHANAKRAWLAMGSPVYPTSRQLEALHAASELERSDLEGACSGQAVEIAFVLPPHAVAAIELHWGP